MNEFFPKRLCWFANGETSSYEPPEPQQKAQAESTEVQQTPEASQERADDLSKRASKGALERDEKSSQAIDKLDVNDPTQANVLKLLVEHPPTREFIEKSGPEELKNQLLALRNGTLHDIQEALNTAA